MNWLLSKIRSILKRSPKNVDNVKDDDVEDFNPIIRQGALVVFIFFGILGGWAIFGQISGAVVVPATIKIDTERKTVQHLEGGIVDKIHVREGDKVVKGQPLVTLKSASVDSSVDMAQKNLILFLAAKNRYEDL